MNQTGRLFQFQWRVPVHKRNFQGGSNLHHSLLWGDIGQLLSHKAIQLGVLCLVEVRAVTLSVQFQLGSVVKVHPHQLTGSWKGPGGSWKHADFERTKLERSLSHRWRTTLFCLWLSHCLFQFLSLIQTLSFSLCLPLFFISDSQDTQSIKTHLLSSAFSGFSVSFFGFSYTYTHFISNTQSLSDVGCPTFLPLLSFLAFPLV